MLDGLSRGRCGVLAPLQPPAAQTALCCAGSRAPLAAPQALPLRRAALRPFSLADAPLPAAHGAAWEGPWATPSLPHCCQGMPEPPRPAGTICPEYTEERGERGRAIGSSCPVGETLTGSTEALPRPHLRLSVRKRRVGGRSGWSPVKQLLQNQILSEGNTLKITLLRARNNPGAPRDIG